MHATNHLKTPRGSAAQHQGSPAAHALEKQAVRWIMFSLGYSLQPTPNKGKAFSKKVSFRDEDATVYVFREDRRSLPEDIEAPVWVGYYSADDNFEMLDDYLFPSLWEYLRQEHNTSELAQLRLEDMPGTMARPPATSSTGRCP